MGATNHTANYSLSQFVGSDKPAWLQDYNGDMTKIDTGINAAKIAADSAALDAGAAQSDATAANNAITNTIIPAITSLQTTVGNQGGAINTINSLIGNGTPTTTDQTIIGAINEINAEVSQLDSDLTYSTMSITAATIANDIHTLITDSLSKGKIPHVIGDFTFTSGGNSYTVPNTCFNYASDYDSHPVFTQLYGNAMLFLTIGSTSTVLSGHDITPSGFSNATLYY